MWWFGERHKNATTLVLLTNSVVLMANAQVDILAFYKHHKPRQPRSHFMWFLMLLLAASTVVVTVKFLANVAFLVDQKDLVKDNHEYLPPF